MYAIVQVGTQQHKISEGDIIETERIPAEIGKEISMDKVLLYGDGKTIKVGQPYLKDVRVKAKVIGHTLGDKVTAFKYRRRKTYAKKIAHRRQLATLHITAISA